MHEDPHFKVTTVIPLNNTIKPIIMTWEKKQIDH
jgi:hypothetical protein